MNVSLRPATEADTPALIAIERHSFAKPHWSARDFLKYDCTLAECEGEIAGFIVVRRIFPGEVDSRPEREILNIATAPEFRRQGIASILLRSELRSGSIYFLEVRESNIAAQALYRNLGFTEVGRRKHYYAHPTETAIVMQVK